MGVLLGENISHPFNRHLLGQVSTMLGPVNTDKVKTLASRCSLLDEDRNFSVWENLIKLF